MTDALKELAELESADSFVARHIAPTQAEIAATYRARCTLVEPVAPPACELPNCLDRDDQKFLELARDSGARALLTRDKLVLKLGKRPVIAARFAILTPEKLQIQLA